LKLGLCYQNGRGVAKNGKEAFLWYQKAAAQGCNLAQFHLGLCYANGLGVERNYKEAVAWYEKAAGQGNIDAQKKLNALN
jgi:TPR repeat protein